MTASSKATLLVIALPTVAIVGFTLYDQQTSPSPAPSPKASAAAPAPSAPPAAAPTPAATPAPGDGAR